MCPFLVICDTKHTLEDNTSGCVKRKKGENTVDQEIDTRVHVHAHTHTHTYIDVYTHIGLACVNEMWGVRNWMKKRMIEEKILDVV